MSQEEWAADVAAKKQMAADRKANPKKRAPKKKLETEMSIAPSSIVPSGGQNLESKSASENLMKNIQIVNKQGGPNAGIQIEKPNIVPNLEGNKPPAEGIKPAGEGIGAGAGADINLNQPANPII